MELKDFLNSVFYRVIEILSSVISRRNSVVFIHICRIFRQFFCQPILLKLVKIVNGSVMGVILKDRGGLLNCSIRMFWLNFKLNFSKFRISSKTGPNMHFSPVSLNLYDDT